ncbi:hypothetical protein NP233_g7153 [Leucocoprinus birnbaumii]|uniref:Amino acid transporter n=1 Tax=Leucocoprinus birnbaumii TaxID=56174 RepID=A0AAD5YPD6_9AGAR|nr:hypothetical protein NP233_g7153 [Leucocoprinus birnbaumii]
MYSTNEKWPVSDTEPSSDQDVLARLGYKEEFKRNFSHLELFGISFTIVGVVQSIAAVLLYSIPYGGPVGMIWGWLCCSVFLVCVAMALAELGSAAPTAGGLYYWTFKYSSPRYRKLLSWLIGYLNTTGYVAGVASFDWGCASQLFAAVNISSGGAFQATTAQTYGLFCAIIIAQAIMSCFATKLLARLQWGYVALNLALFLVVIIVLPVKTPRNLVNEPSYAFGHFENLSGWPNGYAFFMSFLAPAWTLAGFDVSVHISEEAKNAQRAVPFAIMCSTSLGIVLGWVVNIVLAFHIGDDLQSVVNNPIGQPMATIFVNSVGPTGAVAFWAFIVVTLFISGQDVLTVASRQTFAFSRDQGFPISKFLYRMNVQTQTPIYAVLFCATLAMLLGLIAFAGPLAISAIFTMSIACLYICIATPIIVRFAGGTQFVPGPFNLGKMSGPVSFVASAYLTFMIIVFLFPSSPGPTSHSMNYGIVVTAGVLLLSLGYYWTPKYGGRCWFKGPIHTV